MFLYLFFSKYFPDKQTKLNLSIFWKIFIFLLVCFTPFQIFADELEELIIEDTAIDESIKKVNNKEVSANETLEKNTHVFIRRAGGLGSNLNFYIDNSTSSQVNLSIEGFSYSTPSLASFIPTSLYFGVFKKIEINKDNSLDTDNINAHSGNINFKISSKKHISLFLGSFHSFGISSNDYISEKGYGVDIGAVLINSSNDFDYIDFNDRNRVRKNAYYNGGDFYFKFENENIKFLNYTLINKRGAPGSSEFERLEANSENIQNLSGFSYDRIFGEFSLNLKFTYNYKNYSYIDNNPPIFGLNKIEYSLKSHTFNGSLRFTREISDFGFLGIKISDLGYLAKSYSDGTDSKVPFVKENYLFSELFNEFYFFEDAVVLKSSLRHYLNEDYQYSLSGFYYVNDNILLKLMTKKGVRFPYLEEKYFKSSSVVGNKDLLPEIIYKNLISLQINYELLYFKIELYKSYLKNNIIFMPVSFGLTKAVNTQKAVSDGINFDFKFNFYGFTIQNLLSLSKTIYTKTSKKVPQTPGLLNKLSFSFKFKSYILSFYYNYTSKYYNNVFNTDVIPQKHIFSSGLKYKFGKDFSLIFKVNNIFNQKKYYDTLHIPLPARSYFIYFNYYI